MDKCEHSASKLEGILSDQTAWGLSYSKVTPLLDELASFGLRESAPAIRGL